MQGEFLGVWADTWTQIWSKLHTAEHNDDIYIALCEEFLEAPKTPIEPIPSEFDDDGNLIHQRDIQARDDYERDLEAFHRNLRAYENAISVGTDAKEAFRTYIKTILKERDCIKVIETTYTVINDNYGDVTEKYTKLISDFIGKYNLAYSLSSESFKLYPNLNGIFSRLYNDLKSASQTDEHLTELMEDFEDALQDLRNKQDSRKIRTYIKAQINLIEGFACKAPGVAKDSLGDACDELETWPHKAIKESVKKVYGFTSSYPSIRHAGNPKSKLRDIEIKDMIGVTMMLMGASPYLTNLIDCKKVYTRENEG